MPGSISRIEINPASKSGSMRKVGPVNFGQRTDVRLGRQSEVQLLPRRATLVGSDRPRVDTPRMRSEAWPGLHAPGPSPARRGSPHTLGPPERSRLTPKSNEISP